MTTIFAVFGDTHFNSTVSLCPPIVTLDDGGTYRAPSEQLWIWDWWIKYWDIVKSLHRKKTKLYICINADLGDGDHHETSQIISRNPATWHKIVMLGLKPALDLRPDALFFTRGTRVHAGEAACFEEIIARDLDAERDKLGNYSSWNWRIEDEGVSFDIAHYAPGGKEFNTRKNAANKIASATISRYAAAGKPLPKVVIRSHRHYPADSYDNYPVRAIMLPSWQLSTAYSNGFDPGGILPIGGIIVVCEDGQYEVIKHYLEPEMESAWHAA